MKLKEKFQKWMEGRNGIDHLSLFISRTALVLTFIFFFAKKPSLFIIPLVMILYSYWRSLSKNIPKRRIENAKYLEITRPIREKLGSWKRRIFGTKDYKYFVCKNCKTELRVPKRKGKIKVRCPKCNTEYIMRT